MKGRYVVFGVLLCAEFFAVFCAVFCAIFSLFIALMLVFSTTLAAALSRTEMTNPAKKMRAALTKPKKK